MWEHRLKDYQFFRPYRLGEKAIAPEFAEYRRWFESHYQAALVALELAPFQPPNCRRGLRLSLYLESSADYRRLCKSLKHRFVSENTEPADQFARLCPQLVGDLADYPAGLSYFLNDCERTACDFALDQFLSHEKKRALEEFAELPIWEIDGVGYSITVFYYRDSDVTVREASGDNRRIWRRLYELTKPYDELDFLSEENFRVEFSSKQHVDEKCEGRLFYYFK